MGKRNHKETMNRLKAKIKSIDDKYKRFNEEMKLKKASRPEHPPPATVEHHAINGVRLAFRIKF